MTSSKLMILTTTVVLLALAQQSNAGLLGSIFPSGGSLSLGGGLNAGGGGGFNVGGLLGDVAGTAANIVNAAADVVGTGVNVLGHAVTGVANLGGVGNKAESQTIESTQITTFSNNPSNAGGSTGQSWTVGANDAQIGQGQGQFNPGQSGQSWTVGTNDGSSQGQYNPGQSGSSSVQFVSQEPTVQYSEMTYAPGSPSYVV